jgi:hypothetical protein
VKQATIKVKLQGWLGSFPGEPVVSRIEDGLGTVCNQSSYSEVMSPDHSIWSLLSRSQWSFPPGYATSVTFTGWELQRGAGFPRAVEVRECRTPLTGRA